MLEVEGGLIENLGGGTATSDYAAFNFQLGVFGEAGLGFAAENTPMIFRFGLTG